MRTLGTLAVLLFVGCAPAPVAIGNPCGADVPCPTGYECALTSPEPFCFVRCVGEDREECDWLERGDGDASCRTDGVCRISCYVDADCPAPLHCFEHFECER